MGTVSIVLAMVFGFLVGYLTSDVIRKFISAYKEKKQDEENEKKLEEIS